MGSGLMKTPLYDKPLFRLAGDRGLLMEYGDAIDPSVNRRIRSMAGALGKSPLAGVTEIIPTYRSLILIYDPLVTAPPVLEPELLRMDGELSEISIPDPHVVEIPVCYGGAFGEDLPFVASSHDLTEEEVIRLHSETVYPIYMLGFTPGFPYLGGLSEKLHTPRLSTPRSVVPAGSVGIANNQTGIYPIDSPGGWQLIGRSPLKLFDPEREDPILLTAGDCVRFTPVTEAEFQKIARGEEN